MAKRKFDSTTDAEFDWTAYLAETGAEAAPPECFYQSLEPPPNLFEENMKLEAFDPRCRNSVCLATVVSCLGPRIRLRLDGTDCGNDFWALVDSSQIHPIGYATEHGMIVQPPLGFQSDISQHPRFLAAQLANAKIASKECFQQYPRNRPAHNNFRVGMKLEAVDRKNPFFICPATVSDVKESEITVNFDGWGSTFNTKFSFDSRDIFPAGWCKKTGHPLQSPPKRKPVSLSSRLLVDTTGATSGTSPQGSPAGGTPEPTIAVKEEPDTSRQSPSPTTSEVIEPRALQLKSVSNGNIRAKSRSPAVDMQIKLSQSTAGEGKQRTSPTSASVSSTSSTSIRTTKQAAARAVGGGDVKPVLNGSATGDVPAADSTTSKGKSAQDNSVKIKQQRIGKVPSKADVIIGTSYEARKCCTTGPYVDPNSRAWVDSIGPLSVNRVLQLTVQLLIDVAFEKNKKHVFGKITPGNGHMVVSYDSVADGALHMRHLPQLTSTHQYFNTVRELLSNLGCCKNLVSKSALDCPICYSPLDQFALQQKRRRVSAGDQVQSITPHCVVDFRAHATSTNEASEDQPSTSSGAAGGSAVATSSASLDPTEWSVDQVTQWISGQKDAHVNTFAEFFKKHEIDGKALILLDSDMMIRYMQLRLGPALKICGLINSLLGVNRRANS